VCSEWTLRTVHLNLRKKEDKIKYLSKEIFCKKEITRKTTALSLARRIEKLNALMQGWVNYFRLATGYQKFKALDSWVRNRLRYCIWHDWKKPKKREKALIQLGIKPYLAARYARTQLGGWAVAQSPIMLTSVTIKALQKRGYKSFTEYYISLKFNQHKNQTTMSFF
jgi:RNA-directed DNA polymerase